jgi:alpha-N-arabinofuranosidase
VDCPTVSTERYGDVPAITSAATVDPDAGAWSVFLTNRSDVPAEVTVELLGLSPDNPATAQTLAAAVPTDAGLATTEVSRGSGDALVLALRPESWTVLRAGQRR